MVHTQHRAVAAAAPAEVVAIATGQGVRAVTPATASTVVSTTLSPAQSQTRPLVTQVTQGTEDQSFSFSEVQSSAACHGSPVPSPPAAGMQLPQGKPLTPAHLQILRQQQLQHQQQQQQQGTSPQIKAVGKPQVQHQQST